MEERSKSSCTKCECAECKQGRQWLFEELWARLESLGGLVSQWYEERTGEWPVFKVRDASGNEEYLRFDPPEMENWAIIPESDEALKSRDSASQPSSVLQ